DPPTRAGEEDYRASKGRFRLPGAPDGLVEIAHQRLGDGAWREAEPVDLADRRDLRRGAGEKDLLRLAELVRHDGALDDLDLAALGEADDGPPRDAVEEAIGLRRVQLAVDREEDIGAGRFGDLAAPVQHQRVLVALGLGVVLGQRADHVEARGLRLGRRGVRRRPRPFGEFHADALEARLGREIGRPLPAGDGEVDLALLRRDAHLLGAAPGDRPDIAVGDLHRRHRLAGRRLDLGEGEGDLEAEDLRRIEEALRVLAELENRAAIDALALENAARVVE